MRCASQLKRSANVDSGSYEFVMWVSQRFVDFNSRICLSEMHPRAIRVGSRVDSRFTVPAEGTVVREITLTLTTGTLTLQGTVIAAMRGVGFAVRFTELDKDTRDRLSALIYSVRQATRIAPHPPTGYEQQSTR
jgi:hypothetical protein